MIVMERRKTYAADASFEFGLVFQRISVFPGFSFGRYIEFGP